MGISVILIIVVSMYSCVWTISTQAYVHAFLYRRKFWFMAYY